MDEAVLVGEVAFHLQGLPTSRFSAGAAIAREAMATTRTPMNFIIVVVKK